MAVIAYASSISVRMATCQNISVLKKCFSQMSLRSAPVINWNPRLCKSHRNFCQTNIMKSEYIPDYYEVLGVSRSADLQTIKLAYFRQARKFHPDTNKGEEARFMFQFIAEAYDVLSDERKRANYNEFGTAGT